MCQMTMGDWYMKTVHLLKVLVILCISTASSLKCYSCSSLEDEKCGVTWGYEAGQADQYITECEGDTVLCRKLEYDLFPHGNTVVTRSCWNTTSIWIPPETKCREMNGGNVCYCANGDQPCNGTQLLLPSFIFLTVLISLVWLNLGLIAL